MSTGAVPWGAQDGGVAEFSRQPFWAVQDGTYVEGNDGGRSSEKGLRTNGSPA
jgi:hypothetical protein